MEIFVCVFCSLNEFWFHIFVIWKNSSIRSSTKKVEFRKKSGLKEKISKKIAENRDEEFQFWAKKEKPRVGLYSEKWKGSKLEKNPEKKKCRKNRGNSRRRIPIMSEKRKAKSRSFIWKKATKDQLENLRKIRTKNSCKL